MTWALVPNPSYEGRELPPKPLRAQCHDRTPFVTVRCDCGAFTHYHESQVVGYGDDALFASACSGCGDLLEFSARTFIDAFAQMRADGWIE